MMTFKAVIVGCGRIGSEFADDPRVSGIYSHAGAYSANPDVELVAVCDVDRGRADRAAARWRVPAYTNATQMLCQTMPDIVSICSPDSTHAEVMRWCLDVPSVRGIFAEKPLAQNLPDAMQLERIAVDSDRKVVVNYIRRYAAGHHSVRELIARGDLGTLHSVTGLYSGGLLHNGSHWVDLARWLFGEVVAVEAMSRAGDDGAIATPHVLLHFANGLAACLFGAGPYGIFEMDIIGSSGRIRIAESGHVIEAFRIGDNPRYSGFTALLPDGKWNGGLEYAMVHALEDLVSCMRTGKRPSCSIEDGVAALQVCMAGLEAAGSGRRISLSAAQGG